MEFDEYLASAITPQMTLLEKLNAILKFLKDLHPEFSEFEFNVDDDATDEFVNIKDKSTGKIYEINFPLSSVVYKHTIRLNFQSSGYTTVVWYSNRKDAYTYEYILSHKADFMREVIGLSEIYFVSPNMEIGWKKISFYGDDINLSQISKTGDNSPIKVEITSIQDTVTRL